VANAQNLLKLGMFEATVSHVPQLSQIDVALKLEARGSLAVAKFRLHDGRVCLHIVRLLADGAARGPAAHRPVAWPHARRPQYNYVKLG
jgi:hypothetical protein